jgi:catechol 2,3-dioxygenase-like lactoylglutathione lyase family enzyme
VHSSPQPGLAINDVGMTVPDVFAAIDWYERVFGFTLIMGPRVLQVAAHQEAASALGPTFKHAWQAHLMTGNGVGIELFQFNDPQADAAPPSSQPVPFTRRGVWHICVTHPDVTGLTGRVASEGGTVLSVATAFVQGRPWLLAYVADPWGSVFEVMSRSYAEVFSNWPQPGQSDMPTFVPTPGENT